MLQSLRLHALGLDVLIHIMAFLRPSDIISMRQTCKALNVASIHRVVWLNALEQMVEEHHIPSATFQTSSMDIATLEHLALSPAKFAALIENSPDEEVRPCSVRILQDHISKEDKAKYGITKCPGYSDVLLAPGGRFLVTSEDFMKSSALRNLVRVWDLGICGRDKTKLLAQKVLSKKHIRLRSLSLAPDGEGFYLVSEQKRPYKLFVHMITAFDQLPRIHHLNEMEIPGLADSLAVLGTRLAVIAHRTVLVWDFEADLSVSWDSGLGPDDIDYPSPIHLYPENVMLYRPGKLGIWKIPQLRSEKDTIHVENRRLLTLSDLFEGTDESGDDDISFNLLQSPWSHSFCDLGFLGISGEGFRLFRIERLQAGHDAKLPGILPSLIGPSDSVDLSYLEPGASVGALEPCDRRLMFVVENEGDVWVHRLDMLADGSKLSSMKKIQLVLDTVDTIDHVQVCFATGRLCAAVGARELRIIDFLQAP
ncbi:hypothetical protein CPB84DRAFT_1828608 [Gymnopilus junonius]|uniref:F-box domain-containing protein n=1 Tax=Gymnopilus junonius TaxID=109634 RepID=A0A9P5NAJ2_GYMJU|nr:hypothetical protein CPB84DRAFT_1828608 [Gymnopilus junonius]